MPIQPLIPFALGSDAAGLSIVWPIVAVLYGLTGVSLIVALPLLYGLTRLGPYVDRMLGIGSESSQIGLNELPLKMAELRKTMWHRGTVIASVFDCIMTVVALIPVMFEGDQFHTPLYVVAAVVAALGYTVLFITPIIITAYLAERANLRHRVRNERAT